MLLLFVIPKVALTNILLVLNFGVIEVADPVTSVPLGSLVRLVSVDKKLSVRQTEKIVNKLKNEIISPSHINNMMSYFSDEIAKEIQTQLDTTIQVKINDKGTGNIKIFFNSKNELISITKKIKNEK